MPLEFDIRTLFFVGSVASLLCAAMLWFSRRLHGPSREGMVWSAAALAGYGSAMGLIALRGAVPDLMSYPLANALGCAAAPLMYEGIRRLLGVRPLPLLAGTAVVLIVALQFALGSGPAVFETRLLLTSVLQGGFAALSLPLLWRRLHSGEEPVVPIRWAIAFLWVFTVGHLLRFAVTLSTGALASPSGLVEGAAQMLMPTLFSLAPLVYALLLIGLVNGRIAHELWTLATVDMLTGLRTRRRFIEEARRRLAEGGAGQPVLLMIDLDRFKQVNDQFGHANGDRVLVQFAALLRDVAPADALAGRYGGEEFCMLLYAPSALEGRRHAQRLCDAVRAAPFRLADPDPSVTVSIGLADRMDGATLEELLLAADRRLYRAKATGRDRVVATDGPEPHGPAVNRPADAAHPAIPTAPRFDPRPATAVTTAPA